MSSPVAGTNVVVNQNISLVLVYLYERGLTRSHLGSFIIQGEDMTMGLLDHGVNQNQQCEIDVTPFSYAVKDAPISTMKPLVLRHGGNV